MYCMSHRIQGLDTGLIDDELVSSAIKAVEGLPKLSAEMTAGLIALSEQRDELMKHIPALGEIAASIAESSAAFAAGIPTNVSGMLASAGISLDEPFFPDTYVYPPEEYELPYVPALISPVARLEERVRDLELRAEAAEAQLRQAGVPNDGRDIN